VTLVRDHYIPILTGKQGEFQALESLSLDAPAWLSPFIDMPPITPSGPPKSGEPPPKRDSPQVKLGKLIDAVGKRWGTDRRVMVDLAAYDRYTIGGVHPAVWLFDEADRRGVWLMAAVATDSSVAYRDAVNAAAGSIKGLCIRARAIPGMAPGALADAVEALAADLPVSDPAFTYVMLDLGRVAEHATTAVGQLDVARGHLRELDARGRKVAAIAGTSVPAESVERGRMHRERRREWRLWQSLASEPLAVDAAFADYGITGPRSDDDDWRPGPDPHLRYTTSAALLLWRGRAEDRVTDPDDPDGQAVLFPALCRQLVARPDYALPNFSVGDAAIWDAACGEAKPGNGTKWIEFATNHHLTHVVRALQSG
jgi:hypothetical protein